MGFQKTFLQGRLGADAEMDTLKSGTEVTKFRVAVSRRWRSKDGDKKEETTWFPVTAYNGVASGIVDYLTKGKEVTVIGRTSTYSYEKDDVTHYGWEIIAEEVILGSGGNRSDDEDERPARKSKPSSKAASSKSKSSRRSRDEDYDDEDDEDEGSEKAPW